jgi:hypothetical protein
VAAFVGIRIDRIRKDWGNRQEGIENAHKTPVLPKGAKLEHTGVTRRDMDFNKLTEATRDRILAAFRVSKTILGTAESDTNRATAKTADYVFSKRTIKPKMLLVISYINEFLVPRYGDDLYLTFINPTPVDKAARTTEMQAAVSSMPIMTQNEARRSYLGLGPIDGGDQLMMPSTMIAAGTTSQVEGEDQTPQLAKAMTATERMAKTFRVRTGGKTAHSGARRARQALTEAFKYGGQVDPEVRDAAGGEPPVLHLLLNLFECELHSYTPNSSFWCFFSICRFIVAGSTNSL